MLCYIGVGSNVGDRLGYIRSALALLKEEPDVSLGRISPVYETTAVGGPGGQPDYLNPVFELETEVPPEAPLEILKGLERKVGRKPRRSRWAQREIDLDILLYGMQEIKSGLLSVPHPLMTGRTFVLKPLSDLAPHLVPPGCAKDIVSLLADCKVDTNELCPKARKYEKAL